MAGAGPDWNSRYAADEYAYGKDPNSWIAEVSKSHLAENGTITELGAGEGRNSVWLAKAFAAKVTALDMAEEGGKKTQLLAKEVGADLRAINCTIHVFARESLTLDSLCSFTFDSLCEGVDVTTVTGDACTFGDAGVNDAVVASFLHMPQSLREAMWSNVCRILKPGGVRRVHVLSPSLLHLSNLNRGHPQFS
eukprot:2648930-Amphidinium_carterae.1